MKTVFRNIILALIIISSLFVTSCGNNTVKSSSSGASSGESSSATESLLPSSEPVSSSDVASSSNGFSSSSISKTKKDVEAEGLIYLGSSQSRTAKLKFNDMKYTNPVIVPSFSDCLADPAVLKYNGEYYLIGTGVSDSFHVLKSRDLVNWTLEGVAYQSPYTVSGDDSLWNKNLYWAPSMAYDNGRFYLYMSASSTLKDDVLRIGVVEASSPIGPYTDNLKKPLINNQQCIDGQFFKDDNGKKYLFYNIIGQGVFVRELNNMTSFKNDIFTKCFGFTQKWEMGVEEAPVVIKRNGLYYVVYSGSNFAYASYSLGYAASNNPLAGAAGWTKNPLNPVLTATETVFGPGHNDITKAPNNIVDMIVYHTKVSEATGHQRQIAIDRVFWNGDRLSIEGPTDTETTKPFFPEFIEYADSAADVSANGWTAISGTYSVSNKEIVVGGKGQKAEINAKNYKAANLNAEVNAKLIEGSGSYGFCVNYKDKNNYTSIAITSSKEAVLSVVKNGAVVKTTKCALPSDINLSAYHKLSLVKNGMRYDLKVDDVNTLSLTENVSASGSVTLFTNGVKAAFDGIAVTKYFEDNFNDANTVKGLSYSGDVDSFTIKDGKLYHKSQKTSVKTNKLFKGEAMSNYEFSTDFRLADTKFYSNGFGVYALYKNDSNYIKATIKRSDAEGYYLSAEVREDGGVYVDNFILKNLPYGSFDPTKTHTITVDKLGSYVKYYIDGKLQGTSIINIDAGCAGFYTSPAAVEYDNVRAFAIGNPS